MPSWAWTTRSLTDGELIDAMLAHPILINRPIVMTEKGVRLCRPSETVLDLLPPQCGAFAKEDGEGVVDAAGQRVAPDGGPSRTQGAAA